MKTPKQTQWATRAMDAWMVFLFFPILKSTTSSGLMLVALFAVTLLWFSVVGMVTLPVTLVLFFCYIVEHVRNLNIEERSKWPNGSTKAWKW